MVSSDGEQQDAPKASDSIETIKTRTVLSSNNQDIKQTLHFDDGASYVGTLDENGNFSGHGIYTFPDGTKFDGLWIDGQRNGAGTQIWTDGTKYVGNWKNGQRSGTGTITWPNGCRYDGRWKNDNICQGHYYYGDGHHYEGSFNSDWEREGYGTYIGKMEVTIAVRGKKVIVTDRDSILTGIICLSVKVIGLMMNTKNLVSLFLIVVLLAIGMMQPQKQLIYYFN